MLGNYFNKDNKMSVFWSIAVMKAKAAGENAQPDQIGVNPNVTLGSRKEITSKIFYDFGKRIRDNGATILGGCCETNTSHISAISKLK